MADYGVVQNNTPAPGSRKRINRGYRQARLGKTRKRSVSWFESSRRALAPGSRKRINRGYRQARLDKSRNPSVSWFESSPRFA